MPTDSSENVLITDLILRSRYDEAIQTIERLGQTNDNLNLYKTLIRWAAHSGRTEIIEKIYHSFVDKNKFYEILEYARYSTFRFADRNFKVEAVKLLLALARDDDQRKAMLHDIHHYYIDGAKTDYLKGDQDLILRDANVQRAIVDRCGDDLRDKGLTISELASKAKEISTAYKGIFTSCRDFFEQMSNRDASDPLPSLPPEIVGNILMQALGINHISVVVNIYETLHERRDKSPQTEGKFVRRYIENAMDIKKAYEIKLINQKTNEAIERVRDACEKATLEIALELSKRENLGRGFS